MKDPSTSSASLSEPLAIALPTEIMSKIFMQCANIDSCSLTPADTIDMPLLLTKICRSWRTIAIGTRSLWSRLFLSIKPNATQHQTALVSTWLARSGAYPLQIYVMWTHPPFCTSHEVLDIVIQHAHHWRSMYFFLPIPAYRSLAPIRGNLPLLAELSLGTYDDPDPAPTPSTQRVLLDAFQVAPKLRSLECVNLHPDMFVLPWAHLAHIPIMAVAPSFALSVLRRAPRLTSASFICTEPDDADGRSFSLPAHAPPSTHGPLPLRHTHLSELAILGHEHWAPHPTHTADADATDPTPLFRLLSLPHLRSLRICNITCPAPAPALAAHLVPFLTRIDALQALYLRKTALHERDVLQLLGLVPGLRHLTLLSSSLFSMAGDELLRRLTLTWRGGEGAGEEQEKEKEKEEEEGKERNKKPLVPRLATLEISLPRALTPAFVELLESRWWDDGDGRGEDERPVARLTCVEVGANDEYEEELMARLEVLAQKGMTIIIGSTDVPLEDGLEYFSSAR
ncbi:hypothetical protein LshimejAT787_1201520 [Lyophyllum shimeji]|uniref:F-box domain-containing protein n=1 Tax=Lyophyllum shimeji TaxID=47721 RepID=A0A9P3PVC4_LYOSH|nr:hypothetical protein LshimejAT787_1201520 [Lyophyllum shimeji]